MNYLDIQILYKISKRVIDSISFIRINNIGKYSKLYIESWVSKFYDLDEEDKHSLIKSIFESQSRSIQNACNDNVEYITIPTLGHLRLNKTRQNILKVIKQEGTVTDDKIQEIILNCARERKLSKTISELDIKVTINHEKKT